MHIIEGLLNLFLLTFGLHWVVTHMGGDGLVAALLGVTRSMGSLIPRGEPPMTEAELLLRQRRRDEEERLRLEAERQSHAGRHDAW